MLYKRIHIHRSKLPIVNITKTHYIVKKMQFLFLIPNSNKKAVTLIFFLFIWNIASLGTAGTKWVHRKEIGFGKIFRFDHTSNDVFVGVVFWSCYSTLLTQQLVLQTRFEFVPVICEHNTSNTVFYHSEDKTIEAHLHVSAWSCL